MRIPKPSVINKAGYRTWDYPKGSGIKVRELDDRGTKMVRVRIPTKLTGRGVITRQFQEPAAALTFAEQQFSILQGDAKAAAHFSNTEKTQAVRAFELLKHTDIQLDEAVEHYLELKEQCDTHQIAINEALQEGLKVLKPKGGSKTLQEVADELIELKQKEDLRPATVKALITRTGKFCAAMGHKKISLITAEEIHSWLMSAKYGPVQRKNVYGVINQVFNFATDEEYCPRNPLDKLSKQKKAPLTRIKQKDEIDILTLEEAKKLIYAAQEHHDTPYGHKGSKRKLAMLPAVTLGLFCGIRTEELQRLRWEHIHLDADSPFVSIPGSIVKVGQKRHIDLQPNAVAFLKIHRKKSGPIIKLLNDSDFTKRLVKLSKLAKFKWKKNAMRHTFGSALYALTKSIDKVKDQMGHTSNEMFFKHYRELMQKDQAEAYFNIWPKEE